LTAEEVEGKNHSIKSHPKSHSQSREQNDAQITYGVTEEMNEILDTSEVKKFRHHWVGGNLPLNSGLLNFKK